ERARTPDRPPRPLREADCSHPPLAQAPRVRPGWRRLACLPRPTNDDDGQFVGGCLHVDVSNRWQPGRPSPRARYSRGGEYSEVPTRNGRVRPGCTVSASGRPAFAKTGTRSPWSRSVRRSHFVPHTGQVNGPSGIFSPWRRRIFAQHRSTFGWWPSFDARYGKRAFGPFRSRRTNARSSARVNVSAAVFCQAV